MKLKGDEIFLRSNMSKENINNAQKRERNMVTKERKNNEI